MKKLIIVLLSMFLITTANATDSAKTADIEKLLILLKSEKLVDSIYAQTEQMVSNMGATMGVKPSEQKYLDKMSKKMSVLMKNEMSWEKFKGPMVNVYAQNYTGQEIKDMIAFYETESGQSMINKMPKVMHESMQISQGFMVTLMPQIQEMAHDLKLEIEESRKSQ